jgi:hypothetical protein
LSTSFCLGRASGSRLAPRNSQMLMRWSRLSSRESELSGHWSDLSLHEWRGSMGAFALSGR